MPGVPEPEGQPNPRQAEMSSKPGSLAIARQSGIKILEASFHTQNTVWRCVFRVSNH